MKTEEMKTPEMRTQEMRTLCMGIAVALTWMAVTSLRAEESPAPQERARVENKIESNATPKDKVAGLQEQLRRVTAALAVVEKSDNPDSRRVANLTRRKEQLQAQLQELGVEQDQVGQAGQGASQEDGSACPFGLAPLGPGPRAGRGAGGQGGRGQGNCPWNEVAGNDRPSGPKGPGLGAGQGPPPWAGGGQGRGMGRGMGPGMGSGMGPGMGRGQGNGGGAGWGWGRGGGRGMGGGGRGAGL